MKVVVFNGSPNKEGNTYHGIKIVVAELKKEGIQIMRILGKNMAWLMKLIENGQGIIKKPEREEKIFTNFIR